MNRQGLPMGVSINDQIFASLFILITRDPNRKI